MFGFISLGFIFIFGILFGFYVYHKVDDDVGRGIIAVCVIISILYYIGFGSAYVAERVLVEVDVPVERIERGFIIFTDDVAYLQEEYRFINGYDVVDMKVYTITQLNHYGIQTKDKQTLIIPNEYEVDKRGNVTKRQTKE